MKFRDYNDFNGGEPPLTPEEQAFMRRYIRRRRRAPMVSFISFLIVLMFLLLFSSFNYLYSTHQRQALQATSTANAAATGTFTASAIDHYPFGTYLAFSDSLTSQSQRQWQEDGSCEFQQDGYHVQADGDDHPITCMAEATSFTYLTFEATVAWPHQNVSVGLTIDGRYMYMLRGDGHYSLDFPETDLYESMKNREITGDASSLLAPENTLAITINHTDTDPSIYNYTDTSIYLNGQLLKKASADDPVVGLGGEIGVAAQSTKESTAVVFTNAKVWMLP